MLRIALREIRINIFFVIFSALGLSVLLGIIFVLFNFNAQLPSSYWGKYTQGGYISLKSNNADLLNYPTKNFLIYGRGKGLTYDVTLSYNDNVILLPDFFGGICVYSVNDGIESVPRLLSGEPFSLTGKGIWLSEKLFEELDCNTGSYVKLGSESYCVKGVFGEDGGTAYYEGSVSFFIGAHNDKKPDSLFVAVSDADQLTKLAKIDDGKLFNDKEGVLELCRGYNALYIGLKFSSYVLVILLCVFFVGIIRMYLLKRQSFSGILYRSGTSSLKLSALTTSFFTFVSVSACVLAVIWSLTFNSLIFSWADNILNIKMSEPNYFLQWLFGTLLSFPIAGASLLILFRKTSYASEAVNL